MDRTKYKHTDVENEAGLLWDAIEGSQVDRFHEKIVPREKSVLFGYADLTLVIRTSTGVACPIKLRGLVVKSLKGKPHIDMPAEKGADGEWYDHFMPRSAALRTVLTTFVFSDPQVQQAIANASQAPAGAETETSSTAAAGEQPALSAANPFRASA